MKKINENLKYKFEEFSFKVNGKILFYFSFLDLQQSK